MYEDDDRHLEITNMKITTLAAFVTIALVSLGQPLQAAGKSTSPNSRGASFEHRRQAREAQRSVALSPHKVSGVIPRAIAGGNPLQMLNPFAPAQYGTAAESVSVDPDVPRIDGIKLLSISF
jgi:hypothetical protein